MWKPRRVATAMGLVWTAGGTDATMFGLGGLSFTGQQATSPSLSQG